MSQRFEGKNLEEALNAATEALAVQRHELTYHVVLEKRGFLGGTKLVVVEAEVNAPAAPVAASVSSRIDDPAIPEREPAGAGERGRNRSRGRRRGGRGQGAGAPESAQGNSRGRQTSGSRDQFQSGDFEQFLADVPEQGEQSDQARVAAEWCTRVLQLSRLALTVRTTENETQIHVRLSGPDSPRLVEKQGELLDSIQVLANKALVGRKVEKEIELDTEQFKARRMEDLEEKARAIADRVRQNRKEELLPAMSPIERRIVHLALQDDADVTTESRGDGFHKRVAVILRPAAPEQPAATS